MFDFIFKKTILNYNRVGMMIYIIMSTFKCLTDEYRGQHRKNECLDKGHQDLDEINKYGKRN